MSIEFSTKSFEPNWSVDSLWWGINSVEWKSKAKKEELSPAEIKEVWWFYKKLFWKDIHSMSKVVWWSTTLDFCNKKVEWYKLVLASGDKGKIDKYVQDSRNEIQWLNRGYAAWFNVDSMVNDINERNSGNYKNCLKNFGKDFSKDFGKDLQQNIKDIGYINMKIVEEISTNNEDLWLILFDALVSIKKWEWRGLNSRIVLSDLWKERLKKYLEENDINVPDLDSITLGRLNENVFSKEDVVKPAIAYALNDKFLDSLDKKLWTTLNVRDADIAVDKVIQNPNSLQLFMDYYEYENPGYLGLLWITDVSKLSPWQQQEIKKLIKGNLYKNGFLVSLSEEEKADIDNKMEMEHKRARRRYEMWSRNNRYKEMAAKRREILEKQVDYDMAPGWKISYDMKIWDKLLDKYNSSVENLDLHDERVFKVARASFFRKYEWLLSDKISKDPSEVKDLYRNTAWFTNFENDSMEEIKKLCKDQDEFSQLCSTLGLFSSHLKESQKLLSGFASKLNTKKDTGINNIAVGSVIDGIRKIFSSIKLQDSDKKEQLKFDVKNPAELDDDNNSLLFNWSFKWEPVKIKYDLLTWELYMNTSIREMNGVGQWKIVFWEKDPNLYVWTIEDFSSIIEYYGNPINDLQKERLNSENTGSRERRLNMRSMMESEITRIWEKVKSLEANQIKNGVTTDFLKSLGIIDENTKWTVHFEEWSDVYKVVQLINKSKKEDIDFFQQTMRKLSDFIWINWWNKISNKNAVEYRTILANQSNLNNGVNDLSVLNNFWENIKDFSYYNGSPWLISKDCKNWIATVIYENFVKWESPNRYLDKGTIYDYWKNIVQQYDTLEWYSGLEGV